MPLDFPVEYVRELIQEFHARKVLDPCHGWGGRLVGSMLEDVEEYTGIDPSPYAHNGVDKIKNAFSEYSETKVELIKKPYEDCCLKENYYDFALTSPPYFDVEKYAGEDSSTSRYNNYDIWKEKFYSVLIRNTYKYLKNGGVFCLQVGSQSYPLKEDALKIANSVGFISSVRSLNGLTSQNALHNTEEEKGECLIIFSKL